MPIAPAPAQINGQTTWAPFDVSGVAYDFTKLSSMPSTLYETDPYRERLGEDGWEVERTWRCNWSDVPAAFQWFYGYSFISNQQQANVQGPAPNGQLPGGGNFPGPPGAQPAGQLSRVIPAQDPYRPYLYVDRVELIEGAGAFVQDPNLFLQDITGAKITLSGQRIPAGQRVLNAGGAPGQGVGPAPAGGAGGGVPPEMLPGIQVPGMVYAELLGPSAIVAGQVAGNFSDGVATLRVNYRQRPYVIRNDVQNQKWGQGEIGRHVERQVHYAIQGLPLANVATAGLLKFTAGPSAGNVIPEAGVMLIPAASYRYIWHDVPFYPSAAIAACVGKVNTAAFDGNGPWPQFAAQTLLCQAPEISWRRNACGQPAFRVEWVLDWRPAGWNSFPAKDGAFYNATFGGAAPDNVNGTNLVFKPTDFGQLFAIGQTFTLN